MSSINGKMGLKPAGKRPMMKLPTDRATRVKLTAAQCPECQQRGANMSRLSTQVGWYVCTWCNHAWDPEADVGPARANQEDFRLHGTSENT